MGTIAVIGAGGFVGSRLIESLVLDGANDVLAIVRATRSVARLCRLGSAVQIKIADAQNEDELSTAIKDRSTVVNLVSGEPEVIIKSTRAIYDSCMRVGVKHLIHLSSAVVYGEVDSADINDDSPLARNHWNPYARAKAKAELFLRKVSNSSPVEITVLRPGIVWGPRSRWSIDAALDLLNNTAYLVGDGSGVCNTIYIDNLISCILACCNHRTSASGFFNVSDDEFVTWRDFYSSLAEYFNYDMSKIPTVPADRFRPSFSVRLQDIMSTSIYINLKKRVAPENRALIKQWLMRLGKVGDYWEINKNPGKIHITRVMWHLQTTKHKLSDYKFSKHFNYSVPFSFRHGTHMTINWLKHLGL